MNHHPHLFSGRGFARRGFLKSAFAVAAASAAPNMITSFSLFGAENKPGPNDKINLGIIGMGKRTYCTLLEFLVNLDDVRVLAVCDPDNLRRDLAQQKTEALYAAKTPGGTNTACAAYNDFRDVLARKDIDAVVIATPDHWHVPMSLMAMKAGKHVYCEKPETLGVAEGRILVDFCAKSDRIFSGGSQLTVKNGYNLKQLTRSGLLGQLREAHIHSFPAGFDMKKPMEGSQPTPEGLDWDLWLGPAPVVPFSMFYHNHKDPAESNFNPWNRFRIFGGGNLADWGSHVLGGLLWGCDLDNTGPVEITAWPDRPVPPNNVEPILEYTFASGFRILHKFVDPKFASMIYVKGDLGDTSFESLKKLDRTKAQAVKVLDYKEQGEPPRDFIHCIRTGSKKTFRNPESVHRVGTALHLGNISYVLGGRKLRFDPEKEQIVGDDEANALLVRAYRDPWGIES